jgi:hypothetical protein
MSRIRLRYYPHVAATLALFIALGGPSYAADVADHVVPKSADTPAHAARTLPRNSVGGKQLRRSAVTSSKIKNHTIVSADIARGTWNAIRGKTGPAGAQGPQGAPGANAVSYFALVSGAGEFLRGNALSGTHTTNGSGYYVVTFPRDVGACVPSITLGGIGASQPPGSATWHTDGNGIGIQLYDGAGAPVDREFSVIVVC